MYVCLCHGVTDRDIRAAAANGARTLKDLRRDLGVTSECGRCACCARDCLKEAHTALGSCSSACATLCGNAPLPLLQAA